MNLHEHDFEGHRWTHRHATDGPHDHPVKSRTLVGAAEILRLDGPPEVDAEGRPAVTFLRVNW
jgi:hypothetical protein